MEPQVSLITLGVRDFDAARAFYAALGWEGREVDATVFFQAGGQIIALWSQESLATDAGIRVDDVAAAGCGGIALAHNVRSEREVDQIISVARRAGATVTKEPQPTFYGGYAGYFRDPDGHLWEIAYNPHFALDADGAITLPEFGTDDV